MGPSPRSVLLILLALTLLSAAPRMATAQSPKPHGPNVLDAWHEPEAPLRGQDVRVHVRLEPASKVEHVVLTYCRAEEYACAPSVSMTPSSGSNYSATIPWRGDFFRGVEHVGYNFTLQYPDGNKTYSPLGYWPYRPASLPPEAGIYYFYKLPREEARTTAPSMLASLLMFTLVVALKRRFG